MRALLFLVELCLALPWWGTAFVVVGLVASVAAIGFWLSWKLRSITQEALTLAGSPLADAQVTVHSITPTERPTTNSLFDVEDELDEDYNVDEDDDEWSGPSPFNDPEAWQTEGDFYWLDVTIEPRDAAAEWDASILTLVPISFVTRGGEISESIGPLHSAELVGPDGLQPLSDGEDHVTGRKRVRLLMAAPSGHAHVKFAYFGATFGELRLPAPLPSPVGAH